MYSAPVQHSIQPICFCFPTSLIIYQILFFLISFSISLTMEGFHCRLLATFQQSMVDAEYWKLTEEPGCKRKFVTLCYSTLTEIRPQWPQQSFPCTFTMLTAVSSASCCKVAEDCHDGHNQIVICIPQIVDKMSDWSSSLIFINTNEGLQSLGYIYATGVCISDSEVMMQILRQEPAARSSKDPNALHLDNYPVPFNKEARALVSLWTFDSQDLRRLDIFPTVKQITTLQHPPCNVDP